jgi:hypothetical protein
MSRHVRYRVTALVLGGLLLGVPLLANGTASAGQVEDAGRQVTFAGGGVLGLSCRARPDVGSMTVPADSTVRLVNRTGHSARLLLNGAAKGSIPDDGWAQVVFRRGTTAVLLHPDCALGDQATPLLVTAAPTVDPSAAMPDPIPAPSDSSAEPASASATGTPSGGLPDTTGSDQHAVASHSRPGTPPSSLSAAAAAAEAMPQGGAATRPTRGARGTAAAPARFAGMPQGERKAVLRGVPGIEASPVAGPAQLGTAAPAVTAERVAAVEPLSRSGSIGLLALIAAVCVIGVAAGAIRTMVVERASRARIA